MGKKDARVDAYIAKSAPFAQPILRHIRQLVHATCPDVEETVKWRMPHFVHKEILCGMAGFKEHCAIWFWKADLIFDGDPRRREEAMGDFGRITRLSDLPSDRALSDYIRKAAKLNKAGIRKPPRAKKERSKIAVPDDLRIALGKNKAAQKTYDSFSYSNKKEYVVWITGAKRSETRAQRLRTAIEWMAAGKPQNWKYLKRA